MSDPIGGIGQRVAQRIAHLGQDLGGHALPLGRPDAGGSFAETLTRAVNEVSGKQDAAQELMGKFTRGEPVELHQVMAATEEAGLALEMLVEIRNKCADAYRTLTTMQS